MWTKNYLCGWNIPSVSCHLHTAVHYQWFHQQSAIPTHVRPPISQISRWLQSLFLLAQKGGSESRPMSQPKSSDGRFWAGVGATCSAPISWCWYPRMLLPFFTVPLEEGSSTWPDWSVQEWSCDTTIHSQCCSSCLCASGLCEEAWISIEADAPGIPEADEILHYFKATWLNGHFALRTNNHLERWHNHLKRAVRKAHPNLYEFIEIIQQEQAVTKVTIQQLEGGGRLQIKRRKIVQHEKKDSQFSGRK